MPEFEPDIDKSTINTRIFEDISHLVKEKIQGDEANFFRALSSLSMSDIHSVSMRIDTAPRSEIEIDLEYSSIQTKILDQEHTGSCWIQAGMSLFASVYKANYGVDINFSPYYIHLYDKFMKAAVFLDMMIDQTHSDEYKRHILQNPLQDGGTFQMLIFLVNKFGLMPDCCFTRRHAQTSTSSVNEVLNNYLRSAVGDILASSSHDSQDALTHRKKQKEEILAKVLESLYKFYGIPVDSFVIPTTKSDSETTSTLRCTPLQLKERVSCGNADLNIFQFTVIADADCGNGKDEKEKGKLENHHVYVSFYYNEPGNRYQNKFLMKPIEFLKRYAVLQLTMKIPVWCSLDIHHDFSSKKGIARVNLFDTDSVIGLETTDKSSKRKRIDNKNSAPVHAMLITKAYIRETDCKPSHWKLQNSWGEKDKSDGFIIADDDWVTQHVFQVAILTNILFDDDKQIMTNEELTPDDVLPPYNVFSTVAGARF